MKKPEEALKRELKEEVGIDIKDYVLYDADSVAFEWEYKDKIIKVHHTGIFYLISKYSNHIKKAIKIDEKNDDSLGAEFFLINQLQKNKLSAIAINELEKLGYNLE